MRCRTAGVATVVGVCSWLRASQAWTGSAATWHRWHRCAAASSALPPLLGRRHRVRGSCIIMCATGQQAPSELANPEALDVGVFQDSLDLYNRIMACEDAYLSGVLQSALRVYKDGLRLYGPDRLITSYNGGKDAVVVMHLHRAAMAQYSVEKGRIYRPRAIYFYNPKEFDEVRELVHATAQRYGLDLLTYTEGFVAGLRKCMAELSSGGSGDGREEAAAAAFGFVLGTRRGDPNCGAQTAFTPSSDWMPPFMRVNPIIEWEYGQIWQFLRQFELPYPRLYDQGYTSLGNIEDTRRNPALRKRRAGGAAAAGAVPTSTSTAEGEDQYYPAYMLSDWTLERAGRGARPESTLGCDLKNELRRVRDARAAGLVVIGDEILKGKCVDTNTAFAARRLWEKGITLQRVAVVSDDHDAIAAEVRSQVQAFDVVITSGGLGPTHDDVTIHGVAKALGQRVRENEDMVSRLKTNLKLKNGQDLTPAQLKLAMLPELSRLRLAPTDPSGWPILQCENVFILPGVPQYFETKLSIIVEHFLCGHAVSVGKMVLSTDEFEIVAQLDAAVAAHPTVTFGSYPFVGVSGGPTGGPTHRTVITLEAAKPEDVAAASATLCSLLPQDVIIEYIADDDSLAAASAAASAAAPSSAASTA